jgi:catecholate siderophore receptor
VTGRISERWTLLTSYSHLDSEFVESANPAEVGAALALTPQHSGNVWATGTLPHGITVGAGAQYMGRIYRNSINTLSVPDYWLLSAMASYALSPRLTLRLNANNLADTVYVDRVGGGHYVPGAGRSVVLSAGFDF